MHRVYSVFVSKKEKRKKKKKKGGGIKELPSRELNEATSRAAHQSTRSIQTHCVAVEISSSPTSRKITCGGTAVKAVFILHVQIPYQFLETELESTPAVVARSAPTVPHWVQNRRSRWVLWSHFFPDGVQWLDELTAEPSYFQTVNSHFRQGFQMGNCQFRPKPKTLLVLCFGSTDDFLFTSSYTFLWAVNEGLEYLPSPGCDSFRFAVQALRLWSHECVGCVANCMLVHALIRGYNLPLFSKKCTDPATISRFFTSHGIKDFWMFFHSSYIRGQ